MKETPKIFISYSWTNPIYEDWVIYLAERLVSDGVDVVIDKWNLKEGQDKFNFCYRKLVNLNQENTLSTVETVTRLQQKW